MTKVAIEFRGLKEFRAALRDLDGDFGKGMTHVHREMAKDVQSTARSFAIGTGPMQAHFATSIRGRGDESGTYIGVRSIANAAFWGATKHTGWYAQGRYMNSPPQYPSWIGNVWDVGVLGQGPLAINPAIAHDLPKIEKRYRDLIDQLTKAAWPDA